ncbi:hypothetical protein ACXYMW_15450 [Roseivivax sp. CAU 1761]
MGGTCARLARFRGGTGPVGRDIRRVERRGASRVEQQKPWEDRGKQRGRDMNSLIYLVGLVVVVLFLVNLIA